MKIALLGYGKMGKVIERIALERGHEIVLKKDQNNTFEGLLNADVAIDFSVPDSAVENISECLNNAIPVISGTTGWLEDYNKMVALCEEKNGAFIYGSNFSLGVNLFFALNEKLAEMMAPFQNDYSCQLEEIHHIHKLDAPSGTAISLVNDLLTILPNKTKWVNEITKSNNEIGIESMRIDGVPGTHSINYSSEIDSIEIKHTAHNRKGFALGAVLAAEWLVDKKGVHEMKHVLGYA